VLILQGEFGRRRHRRRRCRRRVDSATAQFLYALPQGSRARSTPPRQWVSISTPCHHQQQRYQVKQQQSTSIIMQQYLFVIVL